MGNSEYIQEGFSAITPYLFAKLELIGFLKEAFGAEVTHTPTPDASGNFHAEAKIGDASILLGSGYFSDPSMAAAIYLYVPDADATYQRALKAGAKSVRAPKTETWGDRVGGIKDPSGNTWWIATHQRAK